MAYVGKSDTSNFFIGEIDELAIWRKGLTSEEILMLYKKDIFKEYYLGREIIHNLFS